MSHQEDLDKVQRLIEHTLLKPDATEAAVLQLCDEAAALGFHGVCVNPLRVKAASRRLHGGRLKTISAIGFPLGASGCSVKVAEAVMAVNDGAGEIDVVMDIGAAKESRYTRIREEIRSITEAVGSGILIKVIIEISLLTGEERKEAAFAAVEGGAHFIKTSTGFTGIPVQSADVAFLRELLPPEIRIKASGGIRTLETVRALIQAGADRIGTSAGMKIFGKNETENERNP